MPEQLQARGISWKVYSSPDENVLGGILSDNILSYFRNFQDPSSVLHQNAFGPQFPVDFLADVALGNLPQVSWLVGSVLTSDHPPSPSIFGENILSLIVSALTANPALWAKTVLLVTYDENGGFFDHVAPMTAPLGTPGEYVTVAGADGPASPTSTKTQFTAKNFRNAPSLSDAATRGERRLGIEDLADTTDPCFAHLRIKARE